MLLLIFFKKDSESYLNPQETRGKSEKIYVNEKCVQSWIAKGFSREMARLICASQLKDTSVEQGFKIKTFYSTGKIKTEKKRLAKTAKEKEEEKEKKKKKKPKIGTFKAQAEVRIRFEKEKPGAMALPILAPERGMKSEHKLQTKMEKLTTEEEKFLTEEQLLKRAVYAKEIRKRDAFLFYKEDILEILDSKTVSNYISCCMKKHPDYGQDKCVAIAMDLKRKGELTDSFEILGIGDAYLGKVVKLNGVYKVPVILAREMIQQYGNTKHFKPFSELAKGLKNIKQLPITIDHLRYNNENGNGIVGYVKQLRADRHDRSIKGIAYISEKKIPASIKILLDMGSPVRVSIGFWAYLGPSGYWGGQAYDVTQADFEYDHLTLCEKTIPRCPADQCGLNLDSAENEQDEQLKLINNYNDDLIIDNYYKILNLEETRLLSDLETNGGIMPKQETDAETLWGEFIAKMVKRYDSKEKAEKICEFIKVKYKDSDSFVITDAELQEIEDKVFGKQQHEPAADDFEAILTRLWKFIGGIASPEAKNEAINRILSKLKPLKKSDSNMDEKEFKESIALKDSEISKLEKELEAAKEKVIQEYKDAEKKRAELIKTIKEFSDLEDSYLEDKCVKTLEIIADAVKEFSPSDEKGKKIPKKKKEDSSKYTRRSPADTFNEINKKFPTI